MPPDLPPLTKAERDDLLKLVPSAGPLPWCKSWVYQSVRHIDRNVDIECFAKDEHDKNGTDCNRWGRYDGDYVTAATAAAPRLLAQLERYGAAILKYPTWNSNGNCHVCKFSYIGNHAPDCIRAALDKEQQNVT